MARQRYCRRLARYRNTLRVSADPVAKPAAHTRAESLGSRRSIGGCGRETDCLLEGTGFEPSVPPRKRRPWREAPQPTIVVSRDDLCLITPSNLSIRRPPSATAERPFARAGPMVRIRLPPARSLL